MPRLSVKILLTTIVGLLTAAGAPAASSVSVIWRDTGTALIGPSTSPSAVASSVILGDIVLTADSVAIFTFVVSIQFDPTELQAVGGGASELPVVDLPGMGNQFSPLVPGITLVDNTSGVIEGFDQITVATGLANATRTLGSFDSTSSARRAARARTTSSSACRTSASTASLAQAERRSWTSSAPMSYPSRRSRGSC